MKILIACEFSGIVTKAFRDRGHKAFSCDLLPTEGNPAWHIQGDVLEILDDGWDLMIAHPPCTYLAVSGAGWLYNKDKTKNTARWENRRLALEFVRHLLDCDIEKIVLENPVGFISTEIRKPDQYIQPYEHGHKRSKKTGLWLKNLPLLQPTNVVEPEWIYYKNGGRCSPDHYNNAFSKTRRHTRSKTYQGIANAMAKQWG